jgi:hypothetical protein
VRPVTGWCPSRAWGIGVDVSVGTGVGVILTHSSRVPPRPTVVSHCFPLSPRPPPLLAASRHHPSLSLALPRCLPPPRVVFRFPSSLPTSSFPCSSSRPPPLLPSLSYSPFCFLFSAFFSLSSLPSSFPPSSSFFLSLPFLPSFPPSLFPSFPLSSFPPSSSPLPPLPSCSFPFLPFPPLLSSLFHFFFPFSFSSSLPSLPPFPPSLPSLLSLPFLPFFPSLSSFFLSLLSLPFLSFSLSLSHVFPYHSPHPQCLPTRPSSPLPRGHRPSRLQHLLICPSSTTPPACIICPCIPLPLPFPSAILTCTSLFYHFSCLHHLPLRSSSTVPPRPQHLPTRPPPTTPSARITYPRISFPSLPPSCTICLHALLLPSSPPVTSAHTSLFHHSTRLHRLPIYASPIVLPACNICLHVPLPPLLLLTSSASMLFFHLPPPSPPATHAYASLSYHSPACIICPHAPLSPIPPPVPSASMLFFHRPHALFLPFSRSPSIVSTLPFYRLYTLTLLHLPSSGRELSRFG